MYVHSRCSPLPPTQDRSDKPTIHCRLDLPRPMPRRRESRDLNGSQSWFLVWRWWHPGWGEARPADGWQPALLMSPAPATRPLMPHTGGILVRIRMSRMAKMTTTLMGQMTPPSRWSVATLDAHWCRTWWSMTEVWISPKNSILNSWPY